MTKRKPKKAPFTFKLDHNLLREMRQEHAQELEDVIDNGIANIVNGALGRGLALPFFVSVVASNGAIEAYECSASEADRLDIKFLCGTPEADTLFPVHLLLVDSNGQHKHLKLEAERVTEH